MWGPLWQPFASKPFLELTSGQKPTRSCGGGNAGPFRLSEKGRGLLLREGTDYEDWGGGRGGASLVNAALESFRLGVGRPSSLACQNEQNEHTQHTPQQAYTRAFLLHALRRPTDATRGTGRHGVKIPPRTRGRNA